MRMADLAPSATAGIRRCAAAPWFLVMQQRCAAAVAAWFAIDCGTVADIAGRCWPGQPCRTGQHACDQRKYYPLAGRYLAGEPAGCLDVVVELELVRVRAEPDGVDLGGALVGDPRLDQVRGEHAAVEQVLVIGLQGVQPLVQRPRHLRDAP